MAGGGTGGHLYPALALGAALQQRDPALRVHYVGARRGVEARVLPAQNVEHTLLPIRGFDRGRFWSNWRLIPAIAGTVGSLARLFRRLRPSLVVGTGGYASAPAGVWAVLTNVPVAVQEQNSHPGFTTRLLSRWARQVHLGFPEAARMLRPGRETEVFSLGNPIRPPDTTIDAAAARARFGLARDAVVLLVVGGSQGARQLNEAMIEALPALGPGRLEVFHQTGAADRERVAQAYAAAGWRAEVVDFDAALASRYQWADVALCRAGALTVAELAMAGLPALLVPYPHAADDHQRANARALEEAGAGRLLDPATFDGKVLAGALAALLERPEALLEMGRRAQALARPDAAARIVEASRALVQRGEAP